MMENSTTDAVLSSEASTSKLAIYIASWSFEELLRAMVRSSDFRSWMHCPQGLGTQISARIFQRSASVQAQ